MLPETSLELYLVRIINELEVALEQFSIECRKTKVITLADHNRCKQTLNQSELEANACNPRVAPRVGASDYWFRVYF